MVWDYFAYVDAVLSPESGLTTAQRTVAFVMARYGEVCWASQQALAERTGLTARSVHAQQKQLAGLGWLRGEGTTATRTKAWRLTISNRNDVQGNRNDVHPEPVSDKNDVPVRPEIGSDKPETVSGETLNDVPIKEPSERVLKESLKEGEAAPTQGMLTETYEGVYHKAFEVMRMIPQWPQSRERAAADWLADEQLTSGHAYSAAIDIKSKYNPKSMVDLVATLVKWARISRDGENRRNGNGAKSFHERRVEMEKGASRGRPIESV